MKLSSRSPLMPLPPLVATGQLLAQIFFRSVVVHGPALEGAGAALRPAVAQILLRRARGQVLTALTVAAADKAAAQHARGAAVHAQQRVPLLGAEEVEFHCGSMLPLPPPT